MALILTCPLLDFTLHMKVDEFLSTNRCAEVRPSFSGDFHLRARKGNLCSGKMDFFCDEPSFLRVGIVPVAWASH